MATPSLPTSYTNLPFAQIKLSHHPVTSPTPTPVILITLNRPTKNNAFTSAMENDLVRAFNLLDLDDRVKVIVVTGAGRMFCAGADLEVGFNRKEGIDGRDNRDGGGRVALAVHRCRKPTIAAINGAAVGVGITMTLPMSIRIVSSTSKVAFPFNRRGLIMEACSSFFLPRLIGHSRAIYLTTTGSVFPASSPHFGDLFNEIVGTSEEVLPRALELAGEIAGKTSGVSNYLMRELMWRGPLTAEETHLLDSRIMWALYAGADVKEGVGAFLEKRDPAFKADFETGVPDCVPWWNQVDIEPRRNLDGKSKL